MKFIIVIMLIRNIHTIRMVHGVGECMKDIPTSKVYPGSNIQRLKVPEELEDWTTSYPDYKPVRFTHESVHNQSWADEEITSHNKDQFLWNTIDGNIDRRRVVLGNYKFDPETRLPLNPIGRTGISGRGLLGRWGPNHASCVIVSRWYRDEKGNKVILESTGKPVLECIVVKFNKHWGIPGGFINDGESYEHAAQRELIEEAMNGLKLSKGEFTKMLNIVKTVYNKKNHFVYRGFMVDDRNTDNAWIEGMVVNAHDASGNLTKQFKLAPGDGAKGAKWSVIHKDISVSEVSKKFLEIVVRNIHNGHW